MKFLDPEGPFLSALGTFADLCFCNILFCLFSLPLVSVGASLTALYDCTLSIVEERSESSTVGQFWRAFRRNFRKGTALWGICLGVAAVLWAYAAAVNTLSGAAASMYRVTFLILLFLYLAGVQYVFPVLARLNRKRAAGTDSGTIPTGAAEADSGALQRRGDPGVGTVLKTAWLLSAVALPQTLGTLAVAMGAVYLSFFLNPAVWNTAVFLWAVAAFAVIAYLQSFLFRAAFRRLAITRGA